MPRLIGPVVAILVVGAVLVPGLLRPAAARQSSPSAGTPCPAASAEENEALIRRYYEDAYNGRNPEVVDEFLSEEFIRHDVAYPQQDQAPGNADDVARVEAYLAIFPDLQITIQDLYSAGGDHQASLDRDPGGFLSRVGCASDGTAHDAGIHRHLARGVQPDRGELDRAGQPDDAAATGCHQR
jgi:hypothetical protein